MGGFEGGDEGGFWDIDILDEQDSNTSEPVKKAKSYIEKSGSVYSIKAYAEMITSAPDKYDTISFVPKPCETFTFASADGTPVDKSSIHKAYQALIDYTADTDIEEFFYEHKVVVTKSLTSSASPVCTSSHAAAFILLVKELCNLVLTKAELTKIGSTVESDVPFFIDNYFAANDVRL